SSARHGQTPNTDGGGKGRCQKRPTRTGAPASRRRPGTRQRWKSLTQMRSPGSASVRTAAAKRSFACWYAVQNAGWKRQRFGSMSEGILHASRAREQYHGDADPVQQDRRDDALGTLARHARGDAEHERAEGRRRAAEHGLGQGDGEPRQDDAPEGVEHGRKDGRSRQEPGAAALLNREAREQASLD